MNFPVVPTITEAIIARAQHPSFGYFFPTDKYYDSIVQWHEKRNGVTGLTKEHIGYENGVLGGVVSALNVLCSRVDNRAGSLPHLQRLYILSDQCRVFHRPLSTGSGRARHLAHGLRGHGEEDRGQPHSHRTILLPHNPTGRVWERWELEKAMEIFQRHGVYVISDEIWSDIIRPGQKHIPTQMVNSYAKEHTVALYAPSKTFNLAGLIGSYHIIYSKWLRDRVDKESSLCHYNEINVLSMHALIGAYKPEGYEWWMS